jgi:pimeloyl-ACP methyl ester carboxylesterase
MSMLQPMPGQPYSSTLPALSAEQLRVADRLERHVRHVAETIGPRNFKFYQQLEETADYLESQLRGLGYTVRRQSYSLPECPGQVFHNLETVNDEGPFTVVGAHYDSVFQCPGANDNASGVAAVLELARLTERHRQLRFVVFTNEEPPFYKGPGMGSAQYVQYLLRERQPVASMVCLETAGYYVSQPGTQRSPVPGLLPDVGDFVAIVGDVQSANFTKDLVGRWQANVPFPCRGLVPTAAAAPLLAQGGMGMSDHACFWDAGIPAVMVTDTVFYRYDHYHQDSDTWEKLTYPEFARMVHGLAEVLRLM